MELPKRKPNRSKGFDYSSVGAYFVTICTQDRKHILGNVVVGTSIARPFEVVLSHSGKIAEIAIKNISKSYPCLTVDNYIIMPNHIHLLLQINSSVDGRPMVVPTISTVIQQMKGFATKQLGCSIWQKSFHDHIVRSEEEYLKIWEYIEYNACKWQEDCYYTNEQT